MSDTITNIRVFPVTGHDTVRANVYFTVAGFVTIKGTVMNGKNGLFVSLPGRSYMDSEGAKQWASDVKPISKEANAAISSAVLTAYQADTNGASTPQEDEIPF